MRAFQRQDKLKLTKWMRFGKNATIEVEQATGASAPSRITADELRVLDRSESYRILTSATTLTVADHGKTIYLNSATEFATTLPAVSGAAGMKLEFIVKAAPSGASYTIISASSENVIKGSVMSADLNAASDGDIETSGGDTITLVDAKAVAGDRVLMSCDGSFWYATFFVSVFDAATITTAS